MNTGDSEEDKKKAPEKPNVPPGAPDRTPVKDPSKKDKEPIGDPAPTEKEKL